MSSHNRRSSDTKAIVVIGVRGSGKSATANSLCDRPKYFESRAGSVQITKKCCHNSIEVNDTSLAIVDTPPISFVEDFEEIEAYVKNHDFDPVQYALIVRIGRFSKDELDLLDQVQRKYFQLKKKTIVIFTNAGDLENESSDPEPIKAYIRESNALGNFLQRIENFFVIDNSWEAERKHLVAIEIFKLLDVEISVSEIHGFTEGEKKSRLDTERKGRSSKQIDTKTMRQQYNESSNRSYKKHQGTQTEPVKIVYE